MNTFFKGRLFIAYIGTISLASSICIPANADVVTDWNNAALDAIRAVSGHSTFSGAAATVLPFFYGTEDLPFTTGSDFLPGVTRSFSTCLDAAGEAAVSRLYGGIHFRSANEDGLQAGISIGEWTDSHYLQLKSNHSRR